MVGVCSITPPRGVRRLNLPMFALFGFSYFLNSLFSLQFNAQGASERWSHGSRARLRVGRAI